MKPIYLLLLVLMAFGFFACTTDYVTDPTEISPQPEGKTMDAASFAEFTSALDDFGLFATDTELFANNQGSEDFRVYIDAEEDEKCPTIDFLTNSDGLDDERTLKEILATRPARNWSTTLTLRHQPEDARRFQNWLTDNFSGNVYVDLRLTILENGNLRLSGLVPTVEDLEQFPNVPLFD